MKTWTNTLLSITLICYIAVSSVAAVHAFPSQAAGNGEAQTLSMGNVDPEMGPNCHQATNDGEQSKPVSVCKIFCAAMGNLISNDVSLGLPARHAIAEIGFLASQLNTREPSLEPHPPK